MDHKPTAILAIPSLVERLGLRSLIEERGGWCIIGEAADGEAALAVAIENNPNVAIIDYSLPDTAALGLVHLLGLKCPNTQSLLYTDHNSREWVIAALRSGVRAFVLKSQVRSHLLPALQALADHRPYWEGAVDEETLTELLECGPRPPPSTLSSREWEVLQMAAEGHTNKEIARALGVGLKTIETHRTSLRRKLGFRSKVDLILYARRQRIVSA